MMNKKHILILVLTFTGLISYAQKNKNKPQEFIVISGKQLSQQDSSLVENLYYSGLKEKVSDNYTLAADFFKRALDTDPLHHFSAYELAQIYFRAKDFEQAKNFIQKAITVETQNEWYWLLSSNIYQELKDYNLLNYTLTELVKIAPDKIEYQLDKANTLMILKKNEEALAIYDTLEQQYGSNPEIIKGKQNIFVSKGDLKGATAHLQKLIDENPEEVVNYIYLGDLYFNNRQKDKALEVYQKAKVLAPENAYINLALADIYNAIGKSEEAFNELRVAFTHQELDIDQKIKIIISYFSAFPELRAVRYAETLSKTLTEVHNDEAKAFAIYGDVLFQKNELEKAKMAYENAVLLNKQIYVVWDQLIRIKLGLNDMAGVVKDGEEALSLFPNQAVLYVYTALAYNQLKQSEKAVNYLNNALNYELNNALKVQVYSSLGDAYQSLKKFKESVAAYEQALALEPDNVYALNNYAYYLSLRDENLEKAERMSFRSNQLEKDNSSFLDTYAWILFRQKKYKDAKEWIERALRVSNSQSATIIEHYGDIIFHLGDKAGALENWKKAAQLGEKSTLLQKKINEGKYFE
ncbi:tetratricopeptide repeat protein [Pedobacter glucosidilyticus]|uniref:tetratricopeptide repeat protein n=1 Tax=Pedobacter glucosidilyticus TaxID=1122941 RepID=UPI0004129460|nr:tetratricopeptide repeat protein [Pedobacter glucosidilyticus]